MPSSSTTSTAALPCCGGGNALVHFIDTVPRLQGKAVGLDMCMKTVVYTIRLVAALSPNNAARIDLCNQMVGNITDCRMMCNQWKWMSTLKSCVKTFEAGPPEAANIISTNTSAKSSCNPLEKLSALALPPTRAQWVWLFSVLTFFFRTFEQVNGDGGYLQKYFVPSWSRTAISWRYKFFKSLALTCAAIAEAIKIVSLRKRIRIARLNLYASQTTSPQPGLRSPTTQATTENGDAFSPPPLSSPAAATGTVPTVYGAAAAASSSSTAQSLSPMELEVDIAEASQKMRQAVLLLLRNLGDMAIYFQWYEPYKANKFVVAIGGMYSGAVGVWLVWNSLDELDKKKY